MKHLKNIAQSLNKKAARYSAIAATGVGGLLASAHSNAAMTFDPAAAITTAQTTYEGYADTIMTWMWVVGPTIMLGFLAWSLLKKGAKAAK